MADPMHPAWSTHAPAGQRVFEHDYDGAMPSGYGGRDEDALSGAFAQASLGPGRESPYGGHWQPGPPHRSQQPLHYGNHHSAYPRQLSNPVYPVHYAYGEEEYEEDEREEGFEEGVGEGGGDHEGEEQFTAEVWDALDSLEQIAPTISAGPRWKLETFLEAMEILTEAQEVLEANDCPKGMREAEALLRVALGHLLEEFRDALGKSSKPMPAEVLREVAMSGRAGQLVDAPIPGTGSTGSYTSSPTSSSPSSSPNTVPGTMSRSGSLSAAAQTALQDWLSAAAVPFLHRMALKLAQGGESQRAVAAYVKVRSEALRVAVKELGIRNVSKKKLEDLAWPDLEKKMLNWIQDIRTVVLVLMGGERALTEEIWEGLSHERDLTFQGLMSESGLKETSEVLLENARRIAQGKNCPERLFALLDMFTTMRDLKPHVEEVGAEAGFQTVLELMDSLPLVMASAVRDTLAEFEAVLEAPPIQLPDKKEKKRFLGKGDSGIKEPISEDVIPAGAGVHPVTSYVVNYISMFLSRQSRRNYAATLEFLLVEYQSGPSKAVSMSRDFPPTHKGDKTEKGDKSEKRPLSAPVSRKESGGKGSAPKSGPGERVVERESVWGPTKARPDGYRGAGSKGCVAEVTGSLLGSLMKNLEIRAKASPEPTLGALFLLNNAAYVHRNMSDPKNQMLVGIPEWKDGRIVDIQAKEFVEKALGKVIGAIEEQGDMRVQLKKFNTAFEELAIKQASWTILDEERRKKTRSVLAARVKELYAQFLLPHRDHLTEFKAYRYTPNAVERVVLDYFFLGTPTRGPVL